jgi:predicted nucleic acid-binding protein
MNRGTRFVDTGYWIALVNDSDRFHDRARALNEGLSGPLISTEAILIELGNTFSRQRWRALGIALIAEITQDPRFEIVPLTSDLLVRAIELYSTREDKEWGMTDCISFVVMRDRGITEALAADQHFIQAGFRALLREE